MQKSNPRDSEFLNQLGLLCRFTDIYVKIRHRARYLAANVEWRHNNSLPLNGKSGRCRTILFWPKLVKIMFFKLGLFLMED